MLHTNILSIRDENNLGGVYNELQLSFEHVEVCIKDIISARVYLEVAKYNNKAAVYQYALVKPLDEEVLLNNQQQKKKRPVDPEKQLAIALKAFATNGFFILIDDIQAETLAQKVVIKADTVVGFIKLTPLVGG